MKSREISRSKIGLFSLACTDPYIGIGWEYQSNWEVVIFGLVYRVTGPKWLMNRSESSTVGPICPKNWVWNVLKMGPKCLKAKCPGSETSHIHTSIVMVLVNDCHSDVSPVNSSDVDLT